MYYHSNGDVQTPGWNRLTQALIDNGTYITGRNTSLKDADGNGRLTLNEFGGNPYFFDPNFHAAGLRRLPGCGAQAGHRRSAPPRSIRAPSISRAGVDFSNTITHTGFLEAARRRWATARRCGCSCSATRCRMTALSPTAFPAPIAPRSARRGCAMTSTRDFGPLTRPRRVAGAVLPLCPCHRQGELQQRRDRAGPPRYHRRAPPPTTSSIRPSMSIRRARSAWAGKMTCAATPAMPALFVTTDLAWDDSLDLTLGGRYDAYNVRSVDVGVLAFEPGSGRGNARALHLFRQPVLQDAIGAWCPMSPAPNPPPSRSARPARC